MSFMASYFGIDFGTTNSAVVAIVAIDGKRVGEAQRIGEDERHPLPSFVAINKTTGEVRTGLAAKRSISDSDEFVVVKRRIEGGGACELKSA